MLKNTVEIHSQEPLTFLLVGKMPIITNKKNLQTSKIKIKDEDIIDFSGFPPEIKRFNKKNIHFKTIVKKREKTPENHPTKYYNFISKSEAHRKRIEDNLNLYEDNKMRKNLQIHQEWNEHFIQPFNEKLRKKLHGERYSEFRIEKSRCSTALNCSSTRTQSIYHTEPVYMPTMRVHTANLRDRIKNYSRLQARDNKLERIVKERDAVENEPPRAVSSLSNPFDTNTLARYKQTRFYHQSQYDKTGRRTYKEQFHSVCGSELSQFPQ